ncbi:MAG: MFS transporter, partial [Chloroflexi bacterium]|nr:MFS transporter [Chloroflexota bacterium]
MDDTSDALPLAIDAARARAGTRPAPTAPRAFALRTFSSLRHRNFRLLWTGNLATQAGYWMNSVAVGWLVFDMTHSAAWLGISGFVSGIPLLLFSLVGGVLADRVNRWKLLMVNQMLGMGIALAYALLLTFGLIELWHILLLSFLFGVMQAINVPTRQAMMPTLVGRDGLVNAVALHSVGMNTMRIVGPSIAGVLIATVGVKGCYWVQAVGYIWAFVNVLQMRVPPQAPIDRARSPLRNLTDGVRYLFSDKTLLGLMTLVAMPTIFAFPYQQLLPLFANDILNVGPTGLGLLTSAIGAGALVTALGLASAGDLKAKGRLAAATTTIYGAAIAAFALSPWFPLSLLALAAAGILWAIASALIQTLLQMQSKPEYVGRIMSVFALTWGLQPIGNLIIGGAA